MQRFGLPANFEVIIVILRYKSLCVLYVHNYVTLIFVLGQTSIQGKIHSHGLSRDGIPQVTATNGFAVCEISRNTIQVKHESGHICVFVAAFSIFTGIHSKSVGICVC